MPVVRKYRYNCRECGDGIIWSKAFRGDMLCEDCRIEREERLDHEIRRRYHIRYGRIVKWNYLRLARPHGKNRWSGIRFLLSWPFRRRYVDKEWYWRKETDLAFQLWIKSEIIFQLTVVVLGLGLNLRVWVAEEDDNYYV